MWDRRVSRKIIAGSFFIFFCLKFLHAHYVLLILHELRRILKRLPNINIVSTHQSTCVTVVGDLHGSLADLMVIFHKVCSLIYRIVSTDCVHWVEWFTIKWKSLYIQWRYCWSRFSKYGSFSFNKCCINCLSK